MASISITSPWPRRTLSNVPDSSRLYQSASPSRSQQEFPGKAVTFQVQSLLGAAFAGLHEFEQAEPLLIESHNGLLATKTQLPRSDREKVLSDALDRLVNMYNDWEKPEQAEQWQAHQNAARNSP